MIRCRWYVLHAYSGYEKKVAESIMDQANKLGISEHIEEVSVPTQNIVEVKRGVRIKVSILKIANLSIFILLGTFVYNDEK